MKALRRLVDRAPDRATGVVDENVDRPVVGQDAVAERVDRVEVGEIAWVRMGASPAARGADLTDLSGDPLQRLGAAGDEQDSRPAAGEAPRCRLADPGRGAGDEYDQSPQVLIVGAERTGNRRGCRMAKPTAAADRLARDTEQSSRRAPRGAAQPCDEWVHVGQSPRMRARCRLLL